MLTWNGCYGLSLLTEFEIVIVLKVELVAFYLTIISVPLLPLLVCLNFTLNFINFVNLNNDLKHLDAFLFDNIVKWKILMRC